MLSQFRNAFRRSRPAQFRKAQLQVEQLEDRLVPALSSPFAQGDVLLGFTNGKVDVLDASMNYVSKGTLNVRTDLGGTSSTQARGMAFDAAGNLYVTDWDAKMPAVAIYDPNGNFIGKWTKGFVKNTDQPESICFDANGFAYVGIHVGKHILKFDPAGNVVLDIKTKVDTDWTQLSPTLTTIVYTSEDKSVYQATLDGVLLPNLTSKLPNSTAFAVRFLPGGGCDTGGGSSSLLVADSNTIVQIQGSTILKTYDTPNAKTVDQWFAINRDPDGTTFWSAGRKVGTVYRFDYSLANPIISYNSSAGTDIVGIAVKGELLTFPDDTTPPRYVVGTELGSSMINVYQQQSTSGDGGSGEDDSGDVAATPDTGGGSTGPLSERIDSFEAFPGFAGGVRVATGDVNGDNVADIVAVVAHNGPPHVKVFDGANPSNLLLSFYAFDAGFMGGLNVTVGDMNGDTFGDIIVGTDFGTAHVKVFSGKDGTEIGSFFAFDPGFMGGVRVAVADLNDDGLPDIVVGAGPGAGPHVKVFDNLTANLINGPLASFYAFDPGFSGGVYVSVGNFNGDCDREIIVGAGGNAPPHVKVFDGATGAVIYSFYAGPIGFLFFPDGERYRAGAHVGSTDLNGDGVDDIVVTFGQPGYPEVVVYDGTNLNVLDDFYAFDQGFAGGLSVGGKIKVQDHT